MKPLKDTRQGKRVRAFQGPNAGKWGTIIGPSTKSRTAVRIQWDEPPQPEQPPVDKLS